VGGVGLTAEFLILPGRAMSLNDSVFDSQSSMPASNCGDLSQEIADVEHGSMEIVEDANKSGDLGLAQKRSDIDLNDTAEEPEEKDDVQGLGFPAARIQRIMRKHPDKKKRYVKEAVHAVAIVTVTHFVQELDRFSMISRCVMIWSQDLFLQNFSKSVFQVTSEKKRKTIALSDVREYCCEHQNELKFLRLTISNVAFRSQVQSSRLSSALSSSTDQVLTIV
jgi:histone H3/H4